MNDVTPSSHFDMSSEAQSRRGKVSGRIRGITRNKLARRFLEDTYSAWEEQGEQALRRAAFHDPVSFVRMVAGLMPQRLEITHPTDGLSDERLAQMLELAQTMVRLKGATPHLTDEKGLIDITPQRGGGGPERPGAAGGEGCPSSDRAATATETEKQHNKLEDDVSPEARAAYRLMAPATEEEEKAILPYPVGRPQPLADHVVERTNLAKRSEGFEDIDPESLF